MSVFFVLTGILLGVGLAMDAFSVCIVNALTEYDMTRSRMISMALIYAGFQFLMPMIGWIAVHTALSYFQKFQIAIPWIALLLLLYIGGKMLAEGIRKKTPQEKENRQKTAARLGMGTLLMQGVATSIDALSVGFTIADYQASMALTASVIIAVVTFAVCMLGLLIGKKVGRKVTEKASVLGGLILIFIGIEIFVRGI